MPNGGHYNRKTQLRKQPAWPAMKRRLERGATKLARQHARDTERALRISLNHQPPSEASGSSAEQTVTSLLRVTNHDSSHETQENAA